jgi:predicted 2-oxoglutarate/Fe(II)-dependent dioxygenase YbiX
MNQKLTEDNYIIVPNFISSSRATELAKKFKEYTETYNLSSDPQVPGSDAKFDYIPFVELLVEKTVTVSQLIGESVLPTYSYARIYKEGNELPAHVDKPQCEISLTVNLDCTEIWNIWIESPDGKRNEVSLCPGDAMLYLGMVGRHGREPFEGESCTQVFLHYVRTNGPYFKYYFDKDHRYSDDSVKTKSTPIINATPSSESPLSKYIKVYENMLDVDECNLILNEYANTNEWTLATTGQGVENRDVRNCDTIPISNQEILDVNLDMRKRIDEMLFKKVNSIAQRYISDFPSCFLKSDSGYDLLRYETGGYYGQHTDSFKEQMRTISVSINLNDDYVGGNMAFFDREIQVRGGTGSAIVFPSNFMYPHEIMRVEEGTRYSIVTWLT